MYEIHVTLWSEKLKGRTHLNKLKEM